MSTWCNTMGHVEYQNLKKFGLCDSVIQIRKGLYSDCLHFDSSPTQTQGERKTLQGFLNVSRLPLQRGPPNLNDSH